jgi:hypothetical protein
MYQILRVIELILLTGVGERNSQHISNSAGHYESLWRDWTRIEEFLELCESEFDAPELAFVLRNLNNIEYNSFKVLHEDVVEKRKEYLKRVHE